MAIEPSNLGDELMTILSTVSWAFQDINGVEVSYGAGETCFLPVLLIYRRWELMEIAILKSKGIPWNCMTAWLMF